MIFYIVCFVAKNCNKLTIYHERTGNGGNILHIYTIYRYINYAVNPVVRPGEIFSHISRRTVVGSIPFRKNLIFRGVGKKCPPPFFPDKGLKGINCLRCHL